MSSTEGDETVEEAWAPTMEARVWITHEEESFLRTIVNKVSLCEGEFSTFLFEERRVVSSSPKYY